MVLHVSLYHEHFAIAILEQEIILLLFFFFLASVSLNPPGVQKSQWTVVHVKSLTEEITNKDNTLFVISLAVVAVVTLHAEAGKTLRSLSVRRQCVAY